MILDTDLLDKSKEYVESFLEKNLSSEISTPPIPIKFPLSSYIGHL